VQQFHVLFKQVITIGLGVVRAWSHLLKHTDTLLYICQLLLSKNT